MHEQYKNVNIHWHVFNFNVDYYKDQIYQQLINIIGHKFLI